MEGFGEGVSWEFKLEMDNTYGKDGNIKFNRTLKGVEMKFVVLHPG
jgi:hypothetical protein